MENETNLVCEIPIISIDDPASPVRTRADESSIHDLADSIRDVGLIQPILVRRNGERFEVIAGHRRLIACRICGMLTVPCLVCTADDALTDTLRLHENLAREDVNMVDQARFIARIMKKNKWTVAFVAETMKRSETFVRDRLALLSWPEEIAEALDNQKITVGAAKWIAKITDERTRRHYLNAAIRSGISSRVAYDWYKAWLNQKLPTPPPIEQKPNTGEEEEVQYYTSLCKLCGAKIAMGDEEVWYIHQECGKNFESAMQKPVEVRRGEQ